MEKKFTTVFICWLNRVRFQPCRNLCFLEYFANLDWHYFKKLDPDSHWSSNARALEAQKGAMEAQNWVLEGLKTSGRKSHLFEKEMDPDLDPHCGESQKSLIWICIKVKDRSGSALNWCGSITLVVQYACENANTFQGTVAWDSFIAHSILSLEEKDLGSQSFCLVFAFWSILCLGVLGEFGCSILAYCSYALNTSAHSPNSPKFGVV